MTQAMFLINPTDSHWRICTVITTSLQVLKVSWQASLWATNSPPSLRQEDAYGEYAEEAVQEVPRANFQGVDNIEAGMQFQSQTEDGHVMLVTVRDVQDDVVIVDANHPMAGKTLHFDVEVTDIRDATEEEIAHGHAHGAGGHHH